MIDEIKIAYEKLAKAVNFKCLGCGKCGCITLDVEKLIFLTYQEVETLKEKDKLYGVIPTDKSRSFAGYLKFLEEYRFEGYDVYEEFKCIFLKNGKCEIHDYKPLICFIHPFQVFTVGFAFGGGMIFDTKCSWVKKHRKKLDKPSKKVLEAYNNLYGLVMKYKQKKLGLK